MPDLQVSTAGRKAEGEKRPLSEKRVPQGMSGGVGAAGGSGPRQACVARGHGAALRLSLHVSTPLGVTASWRGGAKGLGARPGTGDAAA